jgi:hypothetical protein
MRNITPWSLNSFSSVLFSIFLLLLWIRIQRVRKVGKHKLFLSKSNIFSSLVGENWIVTLHAAKVSVGRNKPQRWEYFWLSASRGQEASCLCHCSWQTRLSTLWTICRLSRETEAEQQLALNIGIFQKIRVFLPQEWLPSHREREQLRVFTKCNMFQTRPWRSKLACMRGRLCDSKLQFMQLILSSPPVWYETDIFADLCLWSQYSSETSGTF